MTPSFDRLAFVRRRDTHFGSSSPSATAHSLHVTVYATTRQFALHSHLPFLLNPHTPGTAVACSPRTASALQSASSFRQPRKQLVLTMSLLGSKRGWSSSSEQASTTTDAETISAHLQDGTSTPVKRPKAQVGKLHGDHLGDLSWWRASGIAGVCAATRFA